MENTETPQTQIPEGSLITICLLILTAISVGAALFWLRTMMVPFVLALFVYFGLSLLVEVLRKRFNWPKPVALTAALFVTLVLFGLLLLIVSASVNEMTVKANIYRDSFSQILQNAANALPLEKLGISENVSLESLSEVPADAVGKWLIGTTNAILNLLSNSTLVLIFVIFMLLGSSKTSTPLEGVWAEIHAKIKLYLATKTGLSALTGCLVGSILMVLDVDLAMAFGLFAFLLNFIPSLGSIIATLLPVPLVLVSPDASLAHTLMVIFLPGSVQMFIGNFLEPKILGKSLDIHPVVIIMALIFWGTLWGIVGMFLAVPITAVLKILLARHVYTKSVADLMEGDFSSMARDFEGRHSN